MTAAKYPLGTIATYGPNNRHATKLVAAVFSSAKDREPVAMRKWKVDSGDVRTDPRLAEEVASFLKEHRVKHAAHADRILGCPHEEGIDYPIGETCPECPFWADKDRFRDRPKSADDRSARSQRIGRNEPCPCGSGQKYKRCCGA